MHAYTHTHTHHGGVWGGWQAGIKLWVLTGDKQETAINIGLSAHLLEPNMEIMAANMDEARLGPWLERETHDKLARAVPAEVAPPPPSPTPRPCFSHRDRDEAYRFYSTCLCTHEQASPLAASCMWAAAVLTEAVAGRRTWRW
jgi:hypothetical protein